MVFEYWEKYEKADYFERKELIKTLPLLYDLPKIMKLEKDKDILEYVFYGNIQSYFDDILEYKDEKKEDLK